MTEVANVVATEAMKDAVTTAAMDVTTQVANQAIVTAKTGAIESVGAVISNNKKLLKWVFIFGCAVAVGYYVVDQEKKKQAALQAQQAQIAQASTQQTLNVPLEAQVKEPVAA